MPNVADFSGVGQLIPKIYDVWFCGGHRCSRSPCIENRIGGMVGNANLVLTYFRKVPEIMYQNILHEICQVNNYFRVYGVIMHI